ncbi:MAG: hypothetical protein ACREJB_13940 [Planctomycetaceae bacterium]
MTADVPEWIAAGQGLRPRLQWAFTTDAPLVAIDLAGESGETLAADAAGGLYLLDRRGHVICMTRGFQALKALAWCQTGERGAAVLGETRLVGFHRQLGIDWSIDLPAPVAALAIEPFGNFTAASLASGTTFLFGPGRARQSEFETVRPLRHLRFLATEATLIGCADHGLLCAHELDGSELWTETLMTTVGDMTATADGAAIYLAAFSLGIQVFGRQGTGRGSFLVDGTPNRVSSGFGRGRLAATTMERQLYWLGTNGDLVWATVLPDEPCAVRCDPLGHGLVCGLKAGRLVRLEWLQLP